MTDKPNISTENQPKGAARNPSDTLDKKSEGRPAGKATPNPAVESDAAFTTNGE